jgi:hypothetical protein
MPDKTNTIPEKARCEIPTKGLTGPYIAFLDAFCGTLRTDDGTEQFVSGAVSDKKFSFEGAKGHGFKQAGFEQT